MRSKCFERYRISILLCFYLTIAFVLVAYAGSAPQYRGQTRTGETYVYDGSYDLGASHEVDKYRATTVKGPGNPEMCKKIMQICYQEFLSWGMTPEGAAGILGNIQAEGVCDYTTIANVALSDWNNFRFGVGEYSDNPNNRYGSREPHTSGGIGLCGFTAQEYTGWIFDQCANSHCQWVDEEGLKIQLRLISKYATKERYPFLYNKVTEATVEMFTKGTQGANTTIEDSGLTHGDLFVSDYNRMISSHGNSYCPEACALGWLHVFEQPSTTITDTARIEASRTYYDQFKDLPAKSFAGKIDDYDSVIDDDTFKNLQLKFVPESELIGFPKESELLEEVHSVTLPTGLDDSSYAIRSTYIKEDIEIRQEADARDKVRIATIFAGFMLLLYSNVLIIAFLVDKFLHVFTFSMVHVVTFGVLHYSDEEAGTARGYIKGKQLFMIIGVIIIVALLIINGTVWNIRLFIMDVMSHIPFLNRFVSKD